MNYDAMKAKKSGRIALPRAGAMIEALRGLGYSVATALSDIVDNSISAGATEIDLIFIWNGSYSKILILDNGFGMDDAALEAAMRLGAKSPLEERDAADLGRFGLGLKTASFSQCRKLTVASKKQGAISCLRWDLDYLSSKAGEWLLLEGATEDAAQFLQQLEQYDSGTLVIWESLDRIVSSGYTEQDFLNLMDKVEAHLAMIFHRYLEASNEDVPCISLKINSRKIKPWDPFLMDHEATWSSPVERHVSATGTVEIQCHVLPHKDKLSTRLFEEAAGPEGWIAQQGFYVYRNKRLLVAGSWLGLGRGRSWVKEDAHRLARIRLDIPNTMDADWKIDVRKSIARPPVMIRNKLIGLAEDTRMRARRVFAQRAGFTGNGFARQEVIQAWKVDESKGGTRYKIDIEHPAIKMVVEESGKLRDKLQAMIRVIEETVPIQRIWLDASESKNLSPALFRDNNEEGDLRSVIDIVYRSLLSEGMDSKDAKKYLLKTEPFNKHEELIELLPDVVES